MDESKKNIKVETKINSIEKNIESIKEIKKEIPNPIAIVISPTPSPTSIPPIINKEIIVDNNDVKVTISKTIEIPDNIDKTEKDASISCYNSDYEILKSSGMLGKFNNKTNKTSYEPFIKSAVNLDNFIITSEEENREGYKAKISLYIKQKVSSTDISVMEIIWNIKKIMLEKNDSYCDIQKGDTKGLVEFNIRED